MSLPHYYVARNKDKSISMFGMKPLRGEEMWQEMCCSYIEDIDTEYFPELRWEDPPLRCSLTPEWEIYA